MFASPGQKSSTLGQGGGVSSVSFCFVSLAISSAIFFVMVSMLDLSDMLGHLQAQKEKVEVHKTQFGQRQATQKLHEAVCSTRNYLTVCQSVACEKKNLRQKWNRSVSKK